MLRLEWNVHTTQLLKSRWNVAPSLGISKRSTFSAALYMNTELGIGPKAGAQIGFLDRSSMYKSSMSLRKRTLYRRSTIEEKTIQTMLR